MHHRLLKGLYDTTQWSITIPIPRRCSRLYSSAPTLKDSFLPSQRRRDAFRPPYVLRFWERWILSISADRCLASISIDKYVLVDVSIRLHAQRYTCARRLGRWSSQRGWVVIGLVVLKCQIVRLIDTISSSLCDSSWIVVTRTEIHLGRPAEISILYTCSMIQTVFHSLQNT
jgi:hypothetical protein